MQYKNLNNLKKISLPISAFILSLSLSISSVSIPSATAWSSAQTTVSVFGGSSSDFGYSNAVDSSGNIYTTGFFEGTADFDPGVGTTNLASAGDWDIFVTKLDSSGNLVWAKRFGGSSTDFGNSIAVDSSGNIYTTGVFSNTVDFDPGVGITNLTSAGQYDVFVSKLNSSGNLLWAKSFGSSATDYGDFGNSIAVDSSGNIYTTGAFEGTADFDPGVGTTNLTSAGGNDIFVSKLDSSGNLVWAKGFGGILTDFGNSIALDSSGNIYTTGAFQDTAGFDPLRGTTNLTSAGQYDVFVSKLNSSGNLVWAKSFGAASSDIGESIAVDSSGNVYTTGSFAGTVDFDPGDGVAELSSEGGLDVFVLKLNSAGEYRGNYAFRGNLDDVGYSIALDSSGNVYTTGTFGSTPGDVFVIKLSSDLGPGWVKSVGGISDDSGYSIAVDSSGNVHITGKFEGEADFDPGAGTTNLTSAGYSDIFNLKLSPSGDVQAGTAPAAPTLDSVTAGDRRVTVAFTAGANNGAAITDYEYSLNGGAYTSAGTTTSPFTITGLSGRTTYSVTIKARNNVGLSTASSSLSATTTDSSLDASEATAEAARVAAANAEAARKAKEQKELTEILSIIPKIGELTLGLGETTKSLYSNKCVKGKTTKFVKKGAKCPKGYVKKK